MNLSDAEKLFELEGDYTMADVRRAYKRLAMQFHPDQNKGYQASNYFMQQINEAKQLLERAADANTSKKEAAKRSEAEQARREEEARRARERRAAEEAAKRERERKEREKREAEETARKAREKRAAEEAARKERMRKEAERRQEENARKDALYSKACRLISADDKESLQEAINIIKRDLNGWKDAGSLLGKSERRLEELIAIEKEAISEEAYKHACSKSQQANSYDEHMNVASLFEELRGYKDSDSLHDRHIKAAEEALEEAEKVRAKREKRLDILSSSALLTSSLIGFIWAPGFLFVITFACGLVCLIKKQCKPAVIVAIICAIVLIVETAVTAYGASLSWSSLSLTLSIVTLSAITSSILLAAICCLIPSKRTAAKLVLAILSALALALSVVTFIVSNNSNMVARQDSPVLLAWDEKSSVQGCDIQVTNMGVYGEVRDINGNVVKSKADDTVYLVSEISVFNHNATQIIVNSAVCRASYLFENSEPQTTISAALGMYDADKNYSENPLALEGNMHLNAWVIAVADPSSLAGSEDLRLELALGDTRCWCFRDIDLLNQSETYTLNIE